MSKLEGIPYRIRWVEDVFGIDPADDNVDVSVEFDSGERFVATFFTVSNLRTLMAAYQESGECAGGLYVWSTHMIVLDRLTKANVEAAVADLIQTGEFARAFEQVATTR